MRVRPFAPQDHHMSLRSIALAAALCALTGAVAEAQIAPHRAAYVLSLGVAKSGSGVASLTGAMFLEWEENCDGWTLTQRMRFKLSDGEGGGSESDLSFSSYEARDGLSYRFTLRVLNDGELSDDMRGRATLDGKGRGGTAVFTQPTLQTLILPPGTIFPTEHSLEILRRARAGEVAFTIPVFDGSATEGAFEVGAVIGAKVAPQAAANPGVDRTLVSRPGWRIRMAFFKPGDSAEPDYEIGMVMLDNAVAPEMTFEYPEFSIRAKLDQLEALAKPRC